MSSVLYCAMCARNNEKARIVGPPPPYHCAGILTRPHPAPSLPSPTAPVLPFPSLPIPHRPPLTLPTPFLYSSNSLTTPFSHPSYTFLMSPCTSKFWSFACFVRNSFFVCFVRTHQLWSFPHPSHIFPNPTTPLPKLYPILFHTLPSRYPQSFKLFPHPSFTLPTFFRSMLTWGPSLQRTSLQLHTSWVLRRQRLRNLLKTRWVRSTKLS